MHDVRVGLVFKDFAAWIRSSCVGLNVASYATAKVLRAHGVAAFVFPVRHNIDLVDAIEKHNATHVKPLTHIIISAPWLSVHDLKMMVEAYPELHFVVLSHSNVGFLQADPEGMQLFREYRHLMRSHRNLKIGGNSRRFVAWLRRAYGFGEEIVYLPNLYPFERQAMKIWDQKTLPVKIGAFGAARPEKNFMTAAAAALILQNELGVPIELHMSSGGEDVYGSVAQAIDQMCANTGVTVIRHPWQYWDKFIQVIGEMDLLLQASYTESFNMITADGISMGVPSVVSSAIAWAPDSWKADSDDAVAVARVGLRLLNGEDGAAGQEALEEHNEYGFLFWLRYLTGFRGRRLNPSVVERIKRFFCFGD